MAAYLKRHVAPTFSAAVDAAGHDESKLKEAVAAGTKEVEIWERQAAIYGIYQRPVAPVLVRHAAMSTVSRRAPARASDCR